MTGKRTISMLVGGFTVCPDAIVAELGILDAAVWGVVWRYSRMRDGVCRASQETIGDALGINRHTVGEAIARLAAGGWVECLGGGNGAAQRISVTDKLRISAEIGAAVTSGGAGASKAGSETASFEGGELAAEQPAAGSRTAGYLAVSLPRIKRSSTEDTSQRIARACARDTLWEALAEVCGHKPIAEGDWASIPKQVKGMVSRYTAELRGIGATAEQVLGFTAWWRQYNYRGKLGELPRPDEVVKLWNLYRRGVSTGLAAHVSTGTQRRASAEAAAVALAAARKVGGQSD